MVWDFGLVEHYLVADLAENVVHFAALSDCWVYEEWKGPAFDAPEDVIVAGLTDAEYYLQEGLPAAGEISPHQIVAEAAVVEVELR